MSPGAPSRSQRLTVLAGGPLSTRGALLTVERDAVADCPGQELAQHHSSAQTELGWNRDSRTSELRLDQEGSRSTSAASRHLSVNCTVLETEEPAAGEGSAVTWLLRDS